MGKKLKKYLAYADGLLAKLEAEHAVSSGNPGSDTESVTAREALEEHLVHIRFFQHERLVHLIVTCLFALLTFAVFFMLFFAFNTGLVVLFGVLMLLLIPYIRHYYILENGVQRMYEQYDRMRALIDKKGS